MSSFKLTFKLKQHTPIIHFQHNETGATLRATELKPKLDKFLIEKLELTETKTIDGKSKEVPKSQYKSWFINEGKEHLALDYKVRVNIDNNKIDNSVISSRDRIPNFFANMGDEFRANPKGMSKVDVFDISFITFSKSLKVNICNEFPEFIAKTNFGTRQNKGFGSFYLVEEKNNECFKNVSNILHIYPYIEINSTDERIIYSAIEYYYKRLKAGINNNFNKLCSRNPNCNPKKYKKSYIFKYFNTKAHKGWEKRWIKETFFNLYKDGDDKFFVRALLGLPGNYSYRPTGEPCHKKNDNKIDPKYQIFDEYEIEILHNEIERFKSPITFKPIKYKNKTHIYIIYNDTYKKLYDVSNTTFKFCKKFVYTKAYINKNELKIKTGKAVPSINGTTKNEIDRIISEINNQEKNLDNLHFINNKIKEDKRRNNNECKLNKIIKGQSKRFIDFLKQCNEHNGKYFPPSATINLPPINNFSLEELITNFNENELKKAMTFNYNRKDYTARIISSPTWKKTKQTKNIQIHLKN